MDSIDRMGKCEQGALRLSRSYGSEQLHSLLNEALELYHPAIIRMNRGTVINADHVKKVISKYGGRGPIYLAGIGPSDRMKQWTRSPLSYGGYESTMKDPEFCKVWYVPPESVGGDEPEYEEDEFGHYDAHKVMRWQYLFEKVMTIMPHNIAEIVFAELDERARVYQQQLEKAREEIERGNI